MKHLPWINRPRATEIHTLPPAHDRGFRWHLPSEVPLFFLTNFFFLLFFVSFRITKNKKFKKTPQDTLMKLISTPAGFAVTAQIRFSHICDTDLISSTPPKQIKIKFWTILIPEQRWGDGKLDFFPLPLHVAMIYLVSVASHYMCSSFFGQSLSWHLQKLVFWCS